MFSFQFVGAKAKFYSHDEIVFWNHRIIDDVVQGLTWHALGSIWPQEGIPLVVYKQGRSRGFWYLGSRRWQMSIGLTRHQSLELLLDQWEMHRNLKIVMSIDPFRTRTDWNRMDNEQLSTNQLCFKSILYFPGSWRTSGYSLREACKRPDDDEDVWPRQPGALQWRLQEGGREVHLPCAHRQSLGRDPAGDGNSPQGLFSAFLTSSALLDQVLFMGEFFYQSEKILKRHLRVSLKTSNLISFCPTQPPTPKSSYWKRVITHSTLSKRHNIRWNVLSTSPQHTYYKYFDVAVKMLSKMDWWWYPVIHCMIKILWNMQTILLVGKFIICNLKVGSALSLSNMTRAGEVVVNKGPPLTVSQTLQHGGDCRQ